MISRQTYFPLVMDKVQRHFSEFVSTSIKNNEIWLDYNGTPLKWHYPVGLLFDLYANEGGESSANLPWNINVHFGVIKKFYFLSKQIAFMFLILIKKIF